MTGIIEKTAEDKAKLFANHQEIDIVVKQKPCSSDKYLQLQSTLPPQTRYARFGMTGCVAVLSQDLMIRTMEPAFTATFTVVKTDTVLYARV